MFKLFPETTDDLLDVDALPSSREETSLNYRTRPLSAQQETRLTLLVLFGSLPLILIPSVAIHRVASMVPWWNRLLLSGAILSAGWLGFRKLTGAILRRDVLIVAVFYVSFTGSLVWKSFEWGSDESLRIILVVAWLTTCLIAKQVAAWILAGPTVDFERTKRWKVNLPHLIPEGWSLDCPELLTFYAGALLLGAAWCLSIFGSSYFELGMTAWPFVFALCTLIVSIVWNVLACVFVPWPDPEKCWAGTWRALVVFITYDVHHTPAAGVFRFPTRWLRNPWHRWALLTVVLVTIGFGFGLHLPTPWSVWMDGGSFSAQLIVNVLAICLAGPVILFSSIWLFAAPLLVRFEEELSQHKDDETSDWDNYVERILNSEDELERDHLLMGASELSDYPILVHRDIQDQHGHILGDSGASKTALAMAPQATQLIARADSTVVIIDLKGDRALFESCRREAERTRRLKFRWISNEVGKTSFGFNPFLQSHNSQLSTEQLSQELLQGLSLDYGIEYGAGYFTAMNEIVMNNVLKETGSRSFAELSEHLANREWYSSIGYEEDWKQARHLAALVKRLGSSQAVNVVPEMYSDHPEIHQNAIDMRNLYEEPQVVYLWLRSAVEPTNAPAIARLFLWAMFTAASHQPQDKNRVYFFIDEMQQIISDGIKLIFEQFRDMGGTIIGAHQTAGQLRRQGTDLGDTIDSCTAMKQIFRASDLHSLERLESLSGIKREVAATWYQEHERGTGDLTSRYEEVLAQDGMVRVSEQDQARYDKDELMAISSRRHSSLVRFTFGSGYTQFAGKSIPMKSSYHIPYEEYLRRRAAPWPTHPGAFLIDAPKQDAKEPKHRKGKSFRDTFKERVANAS